MDNNPVSRWRLVRVACASLIVASSFFLPRSVIESAFSLGLYPWIQAGLVPVFNAAPFPVMGVLLICIPVGLTIITVGRWRAARRDGHGVFAVLRCGLLRGLRLALYTYVVFLLMWGFGYRRLPIETRWNLGDSPPEYHQVRDAQKRLLALIHRDCPTDHEPDYSEALESILAAERDLVSELEGWEPAVPTHIKHPPRGWFIAIGIYGVVSPFTLEANVDAALPEAIRLGISGHELAHVFGYCGEADANLVGFVAGLRAENAYARYATAVSMLRYAFSREHAADTKWLLENLPKRAKDDLAALDEVTKRHRIGRIAKISRRINDTYLKTQGVEKGVADYSRGFTLFVHAWSRGLVELPLPYSTGR